MHDGQKPRPLQLNATNRLSPHPYRTICDRIELKTFPIHFHPASLIQCYVNNIAGHLERGVLDVFISNGGKITHLYVHYVADALAAPKNCYSPGQVISAG